MSEHTFGPSPTIEALMARPGYPESEPKHGRPVIIQRVDNGFKIDIGCGHFVETCKKRMFAALSEYWDDPDKAAKKYYYDKQKK